MRGRLTQINISAYADAYRRRAQAREARRVERHATLRDQAARMAAALRARYGSRVRIFLFDSLLEPDLFSDLSDIDLAVEGLSATEYWGRMGAGRTVRWWRLP